MSSAEDIEAGASADAAPDSGVEETAGPPPADEGAEKTFLENVQDALGKQEESPPSSSGVEDSQEPDPTKPAEGAEGEVEDDLTEDEIKGYPPNSQRRIRQLVAKRKEVEAQLGEAAPKAERLDTLIGFMAQHNIEPEHMTNALQITRLINGHDYEGALKVLAPIYQEVARRAGELIPDELREKVKLGYLSEQDAREMHRNRMRAETAGERERAYRERTERAAETQQVQTRIATAAQAADQWAKAKATSDPDWQLKQDLVNREVQLELHRRGRDGYPKTAQEAVAIAEAALKQVEGQIRKFAPKPQERRMVTGDPVSPRSKAEPADYYEAISQALNG